MANFSIATEKLCRDKVFLSHRTNSVATKFSITTKKLCHDTKNFVATKFSVATKQTLSTKFSVATEKLCRNIENSVVTKTLEKSEKSQKIAVLDYFQAHFTLRL